MGILLRALGQLPTPWIKTASRLQWKHPVFRLAFENVAARVRNRDGVIQRGVGRGLSFNPGSSSAGMLLGTRELDLQSAFATFVAPGMTVYDVGANVGFYSVIAARLVGGTGAVHAFEPVEENARMIAHNARLNDFERISVHRFAVGDTDGEALFVPSSNPSWGRLRAAGTPALARDEERVVVRSVDALIQGGLPAPHLVKVDVEGAEALVLEGAMKTFERHRPILCLDLHGTNEKIARLLRALDYEPRVAGSSSDLSAARWDAFVTAVPRERSHERGLLDAWSSTTTS